MCIRDSHDSMYLFLPLTMLFLFSLLLNGGRGQDRTARRLSLLIYLLHPWSIVLVRGAAKLTGLEALLIQNSLAHFCAVAALTLCAVSYTHLDVYKRQPHRWCGPPGFRPR